MASRGYLGPDEVITLIRGWVDVVGGDDDDDRNKRDRDREWWRRPPPWFRGDRRQWEQYPAWYQQQQWYQGQQQQQPGYPGGQQWPPPTYPQQPYPYPQQPGPPGQPPYYGRRPPQWYLQQPPWWRQQNPWYPQMPWQPQQPSYPGGQQWPPPRVDDAAPVDPSGWHVWVPASGGQPGRWERRRAPVIRDHRGTPSTPGTPGLPGIPGVPATPGARGAGGGVTVTSTPRAQDYTSSWTGQWYDIADPTVGMLRRPIARPIARPAGPIVGPIGRPLIGQFPPMEAFPFPARAAVVEAPMPTQANRDILPMSTGVPILPTQSAQITGRPQALVFKIGRFLISNAGTAGGAADWIVNDIKIGNRSQFVQSGDVPGDLFAVNAIDTFVRFDAAQTAMDVVVVVTYIGLNESGAPFFGAMVGTAAV